MRVRWVGFLFMTMKLDHVVIFLSDLDKCLGFYEALLPTLGFSKTRDHVFANAEGIHLDLRAASEPEHGYHHYAPGLNHMGFAAIDRQQIERIGEEMAAAGFVVPEIQEFDDGSALFLKDRDGMRIEVGRYR